ncbi:MAG TPA: GAF domain-containing protein [Patescibacteria group bacterium]|nr:GAF domain-containing protein [Patescibacteria group bacterium]
MSEADLRRRLDSVTAELLSTYEEMEVLTTVAEIAASTADVKVVGRRLLDEAAGLLEADVAFIFYSDRELAGEEPAPTGITERERDEIAGALQPWLSRQPRPTVMAPFHEAAGITHAPDAMAAVPLRCEGLVLGAICLGKRGEGQTFSAGDLKILSVLGSSAASVLLQRKNLDLMRMSRDLEERNRLLKGILAVSREIASSLDLERLLHALANLPTKALGFDRCAVVLEEGARRRLRAVSGVPRVDRADPELRSLERLLDWSAGHGSRVLVQHAEDDARVDAEPPEAAEQAAAHMKLAGARSLLAIPMRDDQGLLGILSFESGTAGFVDDMRLEGATILANQATVALRNARLYGEVPFIGLLAPLRSGLARASSLPRRRLAAWGVAAVALLALLVFGRWDLKVPGQATVLPSRVVLVSARSRGVVRDVGGFHEGDRVTRGAVLARLDTPDLELRLSEAKASEQTSLRDMARLEAEGRAADLHVARIAAERWGNERENLQARIDEASLKAPVDGILLTPRLEERVGELLDVGGVFCTLAEMEPLRVEIAVREGDADVIVGNAAAGTGAFTAALKFHAFPEVDYQARIRKVRSSAEMIEGYRSLVAEGDVEQPPGGQQGLRPGMTGSARIDAGPRPLISILLRRPYRFIRSLIWL